MKKQYIYSTLILTALLCAGCAKEFENTVNSSDSASIELSSVSTDPMTKAVITGTEFTTDEAAAGIGLFLLDGSGNAYGKNAGNVKYDFNSGKWTATSPLRIGNTAGILVGYYPYIQGKIDVKAIPVASSINGTDYLYGSITGLTSAKAKTESLTLSHALARLKITLKRDASFVGSGTLSSLSIEGDGIAAEGTLDATSGEITATKSAFTVSGLNATITDTGITEDCLIVPADAYNLHAVTLTFTIDGKTYGVEFKNELAMRLMPGFQTDITLTVKNVGVTVDGSSIGVWGNDGSRTVTVGGSFKVTVKLAEVTGIEKDIMVTAYAEGASVIVKAQAASNRPIECVLPENKTCVYTKNDKIYTFTISDIVSDLTATVGYTVAHSVKLNKEALNLIKDYGHYRLVATVLPKDAEDKTLIWSSSDESVATVDQQGYVKAFAKGSATITAETKVGGHTATCTVTLVEPQSRPDGTLPGHFSVSDSTVVFFSKGNLYCSGVSFNDDGTVKSMENATWGFEEHQYDTTPSENGKRNKNHISHFMGCSSAEMAVTLKFQDIWYDRLSFFAEKDFSVIGVNTWSTLNASEWNYLFFDRIMRNNVPRFTYKTEGVTIEGTNYCGIFIYPDDYAGMTVEDVSEIWTWEKVNDAGIVFLPAAGYRDGNPNNDSESVLDVGEHGYYRSSTSNGLYANYVYFGGGEFFATCSAFNRDSAQSVRLVTEVK